MRWSSGRRLQLAAAGGRTAPHADIAVAPWLPGKPFGDVVRVPARGSDPFAAVVRLVMSVGSIEAAEVYGGDHVPVFHQLPRRPRIVFDRQRPYYYYICDYREYASIGQEAEW